MKPPQRTCLTAVVAAMIARSPARLAAALAVGASLVAAAPALAQDEEERPGWLVTVGAGARVGPKYPGADSLGIGPMPIFGLRREGAPLPFEAPDEGSGFGFLPDDSRFDFGPSVQLQSRRQEEDVGAPVGDVPFTVEAGAFAHLFLADNLRIRVEGRRGLGGHDGWLGDLSADFVLRDRDSYVFSIGPRARWANGRFHDAYFGVTPAVAGASGLPAFDPGGGIYAVGAAAGLTHMLGDRFGLYAFAGYDRLVGEAADSPIVRAFGSRDQFSGGVGLFFDFRVGR